MPPSTLDDFAARHCRSMSLTRVGVEVAYRVTGEGPAVVVIPSLGRGAEDFDAILPPFVRTGLRVLLPEPRGINASSPLGQDATLHDMAADIADIIEAEGAGPAVLVGHAAGNWAARVLAHDRPDLTRAVALLAAIVTDQPPGDVRNSISACLDQSLPDAERLAHLERVYFAPGADASVWLTGWWPEAAMAQRRAAQQTTGKAWVRVADRHPTLYLGAANDVISPPPRLEMLRTVLGPNVTSTIIENAGHALLPEQPNLVADTLTEWIMHL